ncbi:restriction endonuclease subunit S (plasmid) [Lactiplantibacillus plantarum]|uniref:restriction endonuclease subunit S n=1 Tax=Lactiplantibacillus plantarum TaxID=1590 RepID=UPI003F7945B8
MSNKVPQIRFNGYSDAWEQRKFKDILKTHSFRSYLAGVSENGEYEVIQQGDKPIVGYSDGEPFTDYKDVTLFGDHTVSLYKPKSPFFVATDGVKILSADNFEGDYLYTTLERYKPEPQGYKRHFTILKNQDVWFTENMEEQQKIGSFFKQLDNTITLHQRKLDLLKEQKKGYLQKMFPKNGAKVPELRFAGFADDWEERKLGDLGSVAMNKRIFKEQTSDVGDIPFYKIGTFGGTPDAFISRDIFEEYKSKYQYPEVGDILISASGSIGRTVVYQGYDEYFQDSNIVWLKHDQQLDNSFLKQFYSIVKWQGLEGSTIKRLYNKNILETKITLPSPEEQAQLGSFFKQLDDTIALHQRKLDLLKEQKKGFLQKMFV